MHKPIVSKRYAVLFVALMSVVSTASLAVAAPICAQVLKAPPSGEQISAMFDDLARMALQMDTEKAEGKKRSPLHQQFLIKTSEAKEQLGLNAKQLTEQLRPRISKLQKLDESSKIDKARQSEREKQAIKLRIPQFIKDPKNRVHGYSPLLLDLTVFPDGTQKAIKIDPGSNSSPRKVILDQLNSPNRTAIARNMLTAALDRKNQRIVIIRQSDDGGLEFQFLAMSNLIPMSFPLKLEVPKEKAIALSKGDLEITPDGEGFIFSSDMGFISGRFKNIAASVFAPRKWMPYIHNSSDLFFLERTEQGQFNLKMEKQGQASGELQLPSLSGTPIKIQARNENQIIVIMTKEILFVNTTDLRIVKSYEHKMESPIVIDDVVIGKLNSKVVMKALEELDAAGSLFDFSDFAEKYTHVTHIHLLDNGKSIALEGTEADTGYRYFYILNRVENKP